MKNKHFKNAMKMLQLKLKDKNSEKGIQERLFCELFQWHFYPNQQKN